MTWIGSFSRLVHTNHGDWLRFDSGKEKPPNWFNYCPMGDNGGQAGL